MAMSQIIHYEDKHVIVRISVSLPHDLFMMGVEYKYVKNLPVIQQISCVQPMAAKANDQTFVLIFDNLCYFLLANSSCGLKNAKFVCGLSVAIMG